MLVYWEQSAGEVQEVNSNTKEEDERCEIQKAQMNNVKDREQIINPIVNKVFIFYLQMNNNCRSLGFGMQRTKYDMSSILAQSTIIFAQSSGVFTQSFELWAQSTNILVWSPNVFSQLVEKWAHLTKGVHGEQSECREITDVE